MKPIRFAQAITRALDEEMARDEQVKVLRELSPFEFVTKETPPTLIIHGDADPLAPIEQSVRFDGKLASQGVHHRLVTKRNTGHVWLDIAKDFSVVADWFDQHLLQVEGQKRAKPPS